MKKFIALFLTVIMLLISLAACTTTDNGESSRDTLTSDTTSDGTDGSGDTDSDGSTGTTSDPGTVTTLDTTTGETPAPPTSSDTSEPEKEVAVTESWDRGYGVINYDPWTYEPAQSTYAGYEYIGDATALSKMFSTGGTYNGWSKVFMVKGYGEDTYAEKTLTQVLKIKNALFVKFEKDAEAKSVVVNIDEYPVKAQSTISQFVADQASVINAVFYTNVIADFACTISKTNDPDDSFSTLKSKASTLKVSCYTKQTSTQLIKGGEGTGKYTVSFWLNIPQGDIDQYGDYYVRLYMNVSGTYTHVTTVPVTVRQAEYLSPYKLVLEGYWGVIRNNNTPNAKTDKLQFNREYIDNLVHLFYNTYPRLIARWGGSNGGTNTNADKDTGVGVKEPVTIQFNCANETGVAWASGTTVSVAVDYGLENQRDIGFFSHEITHSVQQYGGFDEWIVGSSKKGNWWVENMATYGGHRYFHWSTSNWVQLDGHSWNDMKGTTDWGAYNDKCKWFFSWMDYKFPTTLNNDGTYKWGLIDTINRGIKAKTIQGTCDPTSTTTTFAKAVYNFTKGTSYESTSWEALRAKYQAEVDSKTWMFGGFGNYIDNFITEGLKNSPNPVYPMRSDYTHGDITAVKLATPVTTGTNLMSGATVIRSSGENRNLTDPSKNELASYAIDGNAETKWCATVIKDHWQELSGAPHFLVIDLGAVKSFNTYTVGWAGYGGEGNAYNAAEWEILISNDNKTWTSVDYQSKQNSPSASYNVGTQSARYILLRIARPSQSYTANFNGWLNNPSGMNSQRVVRMYEFMLFNV